MESGKKTSHGLSKIKIKEKIKNFFDKTLANKKDATFDSKVKGSNEKMY
ncbi:MAG: hypothetical protein WC635_11355 [Bacteriovorax sp.]